MLDGEQHALVVPPALHPGTPIRYRVASARSSIGNSWLQWFALSLSPCVCSQARTMWFRRTPTRSRSATTTKCRKCEPPCVRHDSDLLALTLTSFSLCVRVACRSLWCGRSRRRRASTLAAISLSPCRSVGEERLAIYWVVFLLPGVLNVAVLQVLISVSNSFQLSNRANRTLAYQVGITHSLCLRSGSVAEAVSLSSRLRVCSTRSRCGRPPIRTISSQGTSIPAVQNASAVQRSSQLWNFCRRAS